MALANLVRAVSMDSYSIGFLALIEASKFNLALAQQTPIKVANDLNMRTHQIGRMEKDHAHAASLTRAALSRESKKRKLTIATAADAEFLYVWRDRS